jgi:DNA-binding protein HU-beta
MNKMELVELMATTSELAKSTCKSALDSFITSVENTLKKNKTVVITGFGTFSTLKRKARTGVNPATGKKMQIPAKRVPRFKPGKNFKDIVAK